MTEREGRRGDGKVRKEMEEKGTWGREASMDVQNVLERNIKS